MLANIAILIFGLASIWYAHKESDVFTKIILLISGLYLAGMSIHLLLKDHGYVIDL